MALWCYTMEHPDGRRETNVLAAGNETAARERAQRNAEARSARLVEVRAERQGGSDPRRQ